VLEVIHDRRQSFGDDAVSIRRPVQVDRKIEQIIGTKRLCGLLKGGREIEEADPELSTSLSQADPLRGAVPRKRLVQGLVRELHELGIGRICRRGIGHERRESLLARKGSEAFNAASKADNPTGSARKLRALLTSLWSPFFTFIGMLCSEE